MHKKNSSPPRQTTFKYYSKPEIKSKLKEPRILLFDIETTAILARVWGLYEQNAVDVEKDWYMLSFAYKWLDSNVHVIGLPDFPIYKKDPENDRDLIKKLWELFNQADIIVAHNGNAFDIKKSNARFIHHQLSPPAPYKTIDTLLMARKHFNFSSNKLDDLGKYLGIGRKVETGGYSLWRDCLRGDKRAWKKMKEYNSYDVVLLEQVYLKLMPWSKEVATNTDNCPKCSGDLTRRGYRLTIGYKYQRYQCNNCGGWSSERLNGQKTIKSLISL